MAKIKVEKMVKDFKHIESRRTAYSSQFPYNCGYIWASGVISFDCINLIKSYINYPAIAYKTKPAGFYVQPGQVIKDTTERGILNLCTGRSSDFRKIKPGAYMLYNGDGHGALFVGEYKDPSGVVNTIECTTDMGGGVVSSYTDADGWRWNHKGGYRFGRYTEYGYLTKYVDYSTESTPEPEPEKKKTINQLAKEVIAGKWGVYPERKNLLEKAGYNYAKVQARVNELMRK